MRLVYAKNVGIVPNDWHASRSLNQGFLGVAILHRFVKVNDSPSRYLQNGGPNTSGVNTTI